MAFVSQLDQYALITLTLANTYLGLTSDGGIVDNYIETLINRASAMIENALNRKLEARLYVKERYSGNDQEVLYFRQYPVIAVNLDELIWNSSTKKVTRIADAGSFVTDGFEEGNKVLVQNSDKNSGLLTIGVPGVSTRTLMFVEDIVTDTADDNVILSLFRELWINDSKIDGDDYEVNPDHIYYRAGFSKGHENIRISKYAGYATIPGDIIGKCLDLIKMAYDKDKDVKSEKLGPYSVTFFDNKAKIIESIRDDLSTYINVVI